MALKPYRVENLTLGLDTVHPPTAVKDGALTVGDNVVVGDGLLASAPGYVRVTNQLPRDHAYRLDGVTQYFHGRVDADDTTLKLQSAAGDPFTAEVIFRVDAMPKDIDESGSFPTAFGTLMHKGYGGRPGEAPKVGTETDWSLYVISEGDTSGSSGKLMVRLAVNGGSGDFTLDHGELELGTWYHAAVVGDGTDIHLYVHEVGTALGSPNTQAGSGADEVSRSSRDFYVGALPVGPFHPVLEGGATATVTAASETYTKSATTWFKTPDDGAYIEVSGFSTTANNGYKTVASTTSNTIVVDQNLTTNEAATAATIHEIQELGDEPIDRVQFALRGCIQEIRIWNDERTTTELEQYDDVQLTDAQAASETNLVYYQRLTGAGTNTYFFDSVKGTAGAGSGQSPRLVLQPRDATWRDEGHVLGDPISGTHTLDFDGLFQGIAVPNSYLYRQPVPDDDGKLPFPNHWSASFRCRIRTLVDRAVMLQWVPVLDDEWTDNLLIWRGTSATSTAASADNEPSKGNVLVELINTSGSTWQFRAVVWHTDSAGAYSLTSEESSLAGNGVAVDTEYTVTVFVDHSSRTLSLYVNTNYNTSSAWTSGNTIPSVPQGDYQGSRKYAMAVGRSILRSRQNQSLPGDPNGIEVQYDYTRSFDGEIRQLVIATPPHPWNGISLHYFSRGQTLTLGNVASLGLQITSCWPMDEGRGDVLRDIGASGNAITFLEDPDHVWCQSGIETNATQPVRGLFDHRYVLASGEVRKVVAIAGGSAYEVDTTNGTLTLLADGFRNDDGNIVSTLKYKDGVILCAGRGARGNYHLYQDQLWRLDIAAPEGLIPFGLADQLNAEAALEAGVYIGTFTYYSAHTGKESPAGPLFQFEIKKGRANLAFGDQAEINQTYPTTGLSDAKEPFDVVTSAKNCGFKVASWVGETSTTDPTLDWEEGDPDSGTTTALRAKYKSVKFAKSGTVHDLIDDGDGDDDGGASADELAAVVELRVPRAFVEVDPLGYFEVKSRFLGSRARLKLKDFGTASDPVLLGSSGSLDWGASGTPLTTAVFSGSGDTDHGFVLPASNDPQVTHLRFYRTLANDNQLRLAQEVPNGTTGFKHALPDSQLVGAVLDITSGPAPAVELVSDYQGRAIYIKDPDQPQRVYFSEVNQPWNVPAENVIDFLDGDTIAITGVSRTEGSLFLFKDDTTFVLHPPTVPFLPFTVETRLRDIGCVAPHSTTNIDGGVFFASEKGLYSFDSAFPSYLSGLIETIWHDDVSSAERRRIVAVHDRRRESWMIAYPTGDTSVNGTVVNDRMLVFNYSTGRDEHVDFYGWTRLTNLTACLFAILPDANEVDHIYFADAFGYLYQWDSGTNYGVGGLTDRTLTASAGSASTVTVPQATLASVPDGHKGFWITVVKADGSRQHRLVTADSLASPSVLTVDRNWDSNPSSGDSVLVGSIESTAQFGEFSPAGPHIVTQVTDTFIRATKQSTASSAIQWQWQGLGGVNLAHNEQVPAFSSTITQQQVLFSNQKEDMYFASEARGRRIACRVRSLGPDQPFALREFTLWGDARPNATGAYLPLT